MSPRRVRALVGCGAVLVVALAAAVAWGVRAKGLRGLEEPVLVKNKLVRPLDGEVVALVRSASEHEFAVPVEDHERVFRVGSVSVDVRTGDAWCADEIEHSGATLIRRGRDGAPLWSVELASGPSSWDSAFFLVSGERVFAGCEGTVYALDRATGRELWRAYECYSRLHAHAGTLYARSESNSLLALDQTTGARVYVVSLWASGAVPQIRVVGDSIVVQGNGTRFYDLAGQLRMAFLREKALVERAPGGYWIGDDMRGLSYFTAFPDPVWSNGDVPFQGQRVRVQRLESNDLLAVSWGPYHDSGVVVLRIAQDSGRTLWRHECAPLGTAHSEYFHEAYAEVRGANVVVVSQGSNGCWIEVLDLGSGATKRRFNVP